MAGGDTPNLTWCLVFGLQVLTIKTVSPDGLAVSFTTAFQFYHYGGKEYQSEVALLSRSIVLQSSPDTEWSSKGGHVKIMGQVRALLLAPHQDLCGRVLHGWHLVLS